MTDAEDASGVMLNLWELLRLFEGEDTDSLWWTCDSEGNLRFFVKCSDLFAWGGSDVEEIALDTPDDLHVLREARAEAEHDWPLLWVARKRGMRPQGGYYKYLDEDVWHLFDTCGPERTVGLGNPHPQPPQKGAS